MRFGRVDAESILLDERSAGQRRLAEHPGAGVPDGSINAEMCDFPAGVGGGC
jgi:hypothetical protein